VRRRDRDTDDADRPGDGEPARGSSRPITPVVGVSRRCDRAPSTAVAIFSVFAPECPRRVSFAAASASRLIVSGSLSRSPTASTIRSVAAASRSASRAPAYRASATVVATLSPSSVFAITPRSYAIASCPAAYSHPVVHCVTPRRNMCSRKQLFEWAESWVTNGGAVSTRRSGRAPARLPRTARRGALRKHELVDELDHSRSTVNRAIDELEAAGLVAGETDGYRTTLTGRLLAQSYRRFLTVAADVDAASETLARSVPTSHSRRPRCGTPTPTAPRPRSVPPLRAPRRGARGRRQHRRRASHAPVPACSIGADPPPPPAGVSISR